jgi:hypothetical protein
MLRGDGVGWIGMLVVGPEMLMSRRSMIDLGYDSAGRDVNGKSYSCIVALD